MGNGFPSRWTQECASWCSSNEVYNTCSSVRQLRDDTKHSTETRCGWTPTRDDAIFVRFPTQPAARRTVSRSLLSPIILRSPRILGRATVEPTVTRCRLGGLAVSGLCCGGPPARRGEAALCVSAGAWFVIRQERVRPTPLLVVRFHPSPAAIVARKVRATCHRTAPAYGLGRCARTRRDGAPAL